MPPGPSVPLPVAIIPMLQTAVRARCSTSLLRKPAPKAGRLRKFLASSVNACHAALGSTKAASSR